MKYSFIIYIVIFMLLIQCVENESHSIHAAEQPVTNTYFSKEIEDPYQYLENLKDTAVLSWLKSQDEHATNMLEAISGRKELLHTMKKNDELRSETIFGLKILSPNAYYYLKYSKNHEATILYFKAGIHGEEIEIFNSKDLKRIQQINISLIIFSQAGMVKR